MLMIIIMLAIMMLASILDIKNKTIPIWVIILSGAVSVLSSACKIYFGMAAAGEVIYSLVPGVFLILVAFIAKGSMGFGDGIMLLAAAPAFGAQIVYLGLMIALIISAFVSIILLIIKRAGRYTCLPFIPFLTVGLGGAAIAFLK